MYWQLRISFIYVWIVFFIKFDVILYALELKRKVDVNLDYRKQRKHADLWPQDHQYQMFTETYSIVGNKHQIILPKFKYLDARGIYESFLYLF